MSSLLKALLLSLTLICAPTTTFCHDVIPDVESGAGGSGSGTGRHPMATVAAAPEPASAATERTSLLSGRDSSRCGLYPKPVAAFCAFSTVSLGLLWIIKIWGAS